MYVRTRARARVSNALYTICGCVRYGVVKKTHIGESRGTDGDDDDDDNTAAVVTMIHDPDLDLIPPARVAEIQAQSEIDMFNTVVIAFQTFCNARERCDGDAAHTRAVPRYVPSSTDK